MIIRQTLDTEESWGYRDQLTFAIELQSSSQVNFFISGKEYLIRATCSMNNKHLTSFQYKEPND